MKLASPGHIHNIFTIHTIYPGHIHMYFPLLDNTIDNRRLLTLLLSMALINLAVTTR